MPLSFAATLLLLYDTSDPDIAKTFDSRGQELINRVMDHRAFMTQLPAETLQTLSRRSDRAGLLHLTGHLGVILALGVLIALRVPFWWLLLPIQGVVIVFLFTLEHEATHKTPFANERLNETVGHFCGLMILLPFEWFRYFHLAHHRHTNIPGKDPELSGGKPESWRSWISHVSGIPYWVSQTHTVISNARGITQAPYLPNRVKPRIIREARWMLIIYAAVLLSLLISPLLFWVWLLPVVLGQPVLRLYLLAEHGRCPQVANMFDNTRTTFTNRIIRFLAWNMPYHVEHHVAPNIPFHHLPAFHRLTKDHLNQTEDGYAAFTAKWIATL
jgi:fatty acid desaturase